MAVDKVIACVTIQWKTILYVSRITKIQLLVIYSSETKSQGKQGKFFEEYEMI